VCTDPVMKNSHETDGDMLPTCFPPVSAGDAIVLILGSFPGERSLTHQQYYAHPRNAFWRIFGRLLGFDADLEYRQRLEILTRNNIALWDVVSSCRRTGSLDTAIEKKTIQVNDFVRFFAEHQNIRYVIFNGQRAEIEFRRQVLPSKEIKLRNLEMNRLPSTSPALATLDFEQKVTAWRRVAEILSEHRPLK